MSATIGRAHPGDLPGRARISLPGARPIHQPITRLLGLVGFDDVAEASSEWKGRVLRALTR